MATKTLQTVRFLSEHGRFKLIRQPQGELILPNGKVTRNPAQPGVNYWFEHGELTVREGQDVLADKINPDTGEIVEQDALEWLRSHPDYGNRFYEVEPVAPDPGPLYIQIGRLAAEADVDGLVALGDEENESWQRPEVLTAISDAIAGIEVKKPVKA